MYKQRTSENKSFDNQSSNIRLHSRSQKSQGSQRNNYQNHPDIRVQRFYAGLPPLQTKLQVGKSGDKYEQEADRVADKVVSGSPVDTPLSNKITPIVQQSGNASETEVDSSTQKEIRSTYRHGKKLPDHIRKQLEPKFGLAFGDILIHNDKKSHSLNRKLKSQAFTVGKDVYFGENKYKPETKEGKRLIAHELTHTVQQTGAESIQRNPLDETTTATPDNTDVVEGTLEEPTLNSEFTTTEQDETSTALDNDLSEDANSDLLPEPQFIEKGGGGHKVVEGDSLWKIAKNTYGNGNYWTRIRDANPNKVKRGGDLIFVGEELTLPTIQVPKEPDVPTLGEINKDPLISEELTTTKQDVLRYESKNDSTDGKSKAIVPLVDVEINPTENVPEIPVFLVPFLITSYKPLVKAKVKIPEILYAGKVTNGTEYKLAVEQQVTDFLSAGVDFKFGNLIKGEFKPNISKGNIKLGDDWDISVSGSVSPLKGIVTLLRKGKLEFSQLTDGLVNLDIDGSFGFQLSISPNFSEMLKAANAFLASTAISISEMLGKAKEFLFGTTSGKIISFALGAVAFIRIVSFILSGGSSELGIALITVLLISLKLLSEPQNKDDK